MSRKNPTPDELQYRFIFEDGEHRTLPYIKARADMIQQWGILAANGNKKAQDRLNQVLSNELTGHTTTTQRSDAGFSSGEQRQSVLRAEWGQWQAEYDRLRAKNKTLSHTDICNRVGKMFNRSGRAVRNRVKKPEK